MADKEGGTNGVRKTREGGREKKKCGEEGSGKEEREGGRGPPVFFKLVHKTT